MAGETLNHDGKLFPNNLPPHHYKLMEMIFTVIFLIDLVFRGCIADRFVVQRRYPEHMEVRLPFFRDVLNWFDFLSILPFPIDTMVSIVYKGSRVPKFRCPGSRIAKFCSTGTTCSSTAVPGKVVNACPCYYFSKFSTCDACQAISKCFGPDQAYKSTRVFIILIPGIIYYVLGGAK